MPAVTRKRRSGLKGRAPRPALPEPGIGGWDYPRGPFGATGFPGSTPASRRTHSQGPDGRDDQSYLGVPKDTISGYQRQWATVPARRRPASTYRGGNPELVRNDLTAQQPKSPWAPTPGVGPEENGRAAGWDFPARLKAHTTGPEHRMTPVIGANAPGSQNVRNRIAQRYKADPSLIRPYRASPNPGKTGARLDAPSRYHPDVMVHGHPDGKPVPAMAPQPGYPPTVVVQSRYVSPEGAQEGYAMNRELYFAKGGTPAPYPPGYDGNEHIRGGRYTGQRYFGAIRDQQRIGLDSDAYGLSRRRGPRHRPVRFELPGPHTLNYYDVAPDEGTQAPDMIHRPPARPGGRAHADTADRRQPQGVRQTGLRPRRG